MLLAQGHVELAVGAEGQAAALVTAVPAGRELDDVGGPGPDAAAVGPADHVLMDAVGAGVEGVDEAVLGEGGAHGDAEQTPLAVATPGFRGDRGHGGEHARRPVLVHLDRP